MIVVIQCAAGKRREAGHLQTAGGKSVLFVAQPAQAPRHENLVYARPDDDSGDGRSWRQVLVEYNKVPGNNPLRLLPVYELYANDTYGRLVERFGLNNTFILSAGWGLISASFLTPSYDITFSAAADAFKRRKQGEGYRDFQMVPLDTADEVIFLGGKDYLPLFCSLTAGLKGRRTVFYNSSASPSAPGCALRRYFTTTRTNWHYECANKLLEGRLK
jgi:hypothetical protein